MKKNDKFPLAKSPEYAIRIAEGFYQAGKELAKHSKIDQAQGYLWIAPAAVNVSFALELLIKAILMIDSNISLKGHNILKLYQNIKPSTRKSIEQKYYIKECNSNPELTAYRIVVYKENEKPHKKGSTKNLENTLHIHTEAFENWIYLYEIPEGGYTYEFDFKAMDSFHRSLIEVISDLLKDRNDKFGIKKA